MSYLIALFLAALVGIISVVFQIVHAEEKMFYDKLNETVVKKGEAKVNSETTPEDKEIQ